MNHIQRLVLCSAKAGQEERSFQRYPGRFWIPDQVRDYNAGLFQFRFNSIPHQFRIHPSIIVNQEIMPTYDLFPWDIGLLH
jgi:hypothetical protein